MKEGADYRIGGRFNSVWLCLALMIAATAGFNVVGLFFFGWGVLGFFLVSGLLNIVLWSSRYSWRLVLGGSLLSLVSTALLFYFCLPLKISQTVDAIILTFGAVALGVFFSVGVAIGILARSCVIVKKQAV